MGLVQKGLEKWLCISAWPAPVTESALAAEVEGLPRQTGRSGELMALSAPS